VSRPRRSAGLALVVAAGLGTATAARAGSAALDYALNCQGCHRADGTGTPGSVPALAGSVGKFLQVPGGREFLVRVPGVAQAALDDAALAGVLNWVLQRFGEDDVPKDFVPYAAAEVGRLRHQPFTNVQRVRRELVQALGEAR